MIYLDYNATTPIRPRVIEGMAAVMAQVGNASSLHQPGRQARQCLEIAREQIASAINARPQDVIFTGSGTEANNQALQMRPTAPLCTSAIEHEAVLQARPKAIRLAVTPDGVLNLDAAIAQVKTVDTPGVLSLQLANNETGVIQPVAQLVQAAKQHGWLVHCDGVQAAGKIPIDFKALDLDMLTLSAHKLGGPQGIGALIVRPGLEIPRLIHGGGQERSRRAGTENVAGAVGFGIAMEEAMAELDQWDQKALWRKTMEAQIKQQLPQAPIFGAQVARLPNTCCVALPGLAASTQLMQLDLKGIAVSAGAACSSGKLQASHVLLAMGVTKDVASQAIRISFGWQSQASDLEMFTQAWLQMAQKHISKIA